MVNVTAENASVREILRTDPRTERDLMVVCEVKELATFVGARA